MRIVDHIRRNKRTIFVCQYNSASSGATLGCQNDKILPKPNSVPQGLFFSVVAANCYCYLTYRE